VAPAHRDQLVAGLGALGQHQLGEPAVGVHDLGGVLDEGEHPNHQARAEQEVAPLALGLGTHRTLGVERNGFPQVQTQQEGQLRLGHLSLGTWFTQTNLNTKKYFCQ